MPEEIRILIDTFFKDYPNVRFPKGQLLLLPGETSEKVYCLVEGRVSVYDISYRGDEIILYTFMPNSYFPMATVINSTKNDYFYKADTPIVIKTAPTKKFNDLIRNNPYVGYHLLSRAYSRFEHILERTLHLVSGTAKSRLLFELLTEYKMYGVGDETSGYIETSEASLASRAGLSRETVSREMKHLKNTNLVKIENHTIYLLDIEGLNNKLDSINHH